MFRALLVSRTASRLALAAAMAGITAAAYGADPRGPDDRGRDRGHRHRNGGGGGLVIRFEPRPRPVHPTIVIARPEPVVCRDEIPLELEISAYQSQDRVILLVNGCNRAAGFTTALTVVDVHCDRPELVLRNTAPAHCAAGQSRFALNASFRSTRALHCITVRVAEKVIEVPVTCVPSLS